MRGLGAEAKEGEREQRRAVWCLFVMDVVGVVSVLLSFVDFPFVPVGSFCCSWPTPRDK